MKIKERKVKRIQTVGEEVANSVSHGLMAIFGIIGLILMILKSSNGVELLASIIFGVSMILLYFSSMMYHALAFTKSKGVFKRFDHLSIYMLIGGTFAPALLLLPSLGAPLLGIEGMISIGLFLFIMQWILIITGMVFKSIWVYRFQMMHVAIFLLIGWSAIYFIVDLYLYNAFAMWLILLGGLSYSIGVIFYVQSNKLYFHFIWHIFVALGTILQFIAIYNHLL
ncbi:hemolysin [Acholeplasma oculi]|uniref:Hemolysine III n=1 Tax=Acholeplasma oculi TaxID=35623 RepID=A0A061AIE3_9MOLU|nr:hemolysin III family protein [Acholeplasma oculi]CDR30712.1 Hemolysine III [Acholeplasma oculi]SKC34714.1 hemolysin III [Acholeplasma oculi]SUT89550.1 hemolysin [Acholeplasma oculi]